MRKFGGGVPKVDVPDVPDVLDAPDIPDAPDMDELKDMAGDAMPDLPKGLAFKIWLAKTFSCCFGMPEMPSAGAVLIPK